MRTNLKTAGLAPMHPGEMLREIIIQAVGVTKAEVARHLGISRQQLYGLLAGKKSDTANIALRLARVFGSTAAFWLHLQDAYDLAATEAEIGEELANIKPLAAA